MPSPWQINSLTSRLESLKLEIKRVAEKDHPYPDPDTVYEALRLVIKSRELMLLDAREMYVLGDADSERKLQETLITVADSADEIAEIFSYAERVDSARIPFEILRPLSWVASTLLEEECHAVVRLDSEYNYTIISCRREFEEKGWSEEWSNAVARTRTKRRTSSDSLFERAEERPYTVLLLGFPSYDANSILLHALAAHELGHEIFFKDQQRIFNILDKAVAIAFHKDHRLYTEMGEYAGHNQRKSGSGPSDDYAKTIDEAQHQLLEFLNQWIVEIFSDLFAANLLGPSFIAAFDKIELWPNHVDKKHPPGRFRRQVVKTYLDNHLSHVMKDDVWINLFRYEPQPGRGKNVVENSDPLAPLYVIGEEICTLCLSDLFEYVMALPSPLRDKSELEATVSITEECIVSLAPPSSPVELTGTDSDVKFFWLLIYAAWHYRLDEKRFKDFANTFASGNEARAEEILSNLLLTSLEAIEIRFLWQRASYEMLGLSE